MDWVDHIIRGDLFSLQFKNGGFRIGNISRCAINVGLKYLVSIGIQNETWEDYLTGNDVEPEYSQELINSDLSLGASFGVGFAVHGEVSLDVIGIGKSIFAYFKERW